MRFLLFLIPLSAGIWVSSSFFGGSEVDIHVPVGKFFILCGIAFACSMIFSAFEELVGSDSLNFKLAWLSGIVASLAVFSFGVSASRFSQVLMTGEGIVRDEVSLGFLLMSICLALGVCIPKLTIFYWKRRKN